MPHIIGSIHTTPIYCYMLHGDGDHGKVKLLSWQRWLLELLQPKRDLSSCQA